MSSLWVWVDHSASGLLSVTESPYSDSLSLRLLSFIEINLATPNNSPAHYAKGTRSGIGLAAHSPLTACKRTVSGSFHSPPGVLFTFPSRYWFTIGRQGVFSLGSGLPDSHRVSRVPWYLGCLPREPLVVSFTGLSPSMADRSRSFNYDRGL